MNIYDITLTIAGTMPTWPGDPRVHLEKTSSISNGEESNITQLSMSAHTGTHIDAPHHFINGAMTVDKVPVKTLMGRAYVKCFPNADIITAELLKTADIPPRTRRILFKTKNSDFWAKGDKDFHTDYVALSPDAATYLVKRGVKVVGIDYLSISPYKNTKPVHQILLGAGVIVIEGLDLSEVSQGRYTLYCLPLKISGADGAPARAVLVGV